MGLFQRIRAYSSHAFTVPNLLRLLLLLYAGILDTPFGDENKAESLATSVMIALILACCGDGGAEFQVPACASGGCSCVLGFKNACTEQAGGCSLR